MVPVVCCRACRELHLVSDIMPHASWTEWTCPTCQAANAWPPAAMNAFLHDVSHKDKGP